MVLLHLHKIGRPTFGGEMQLRGYGFSHHRGGRNSFLVSGNPL
jgi:hypothetical protein